MAFFEDAFKGQNLWIGIGLAIAAPVILPVVGAVARPVAKTAIKGYLAAMDALGPLTTATTSRMGEMYSGMRQQVSALVDEAKNEYQSGGVLGTKTGEGAPQQPATTG